MQNYNVKQVKYYKIYSYKYLKMGIHNLSCNLRREHSSELYGRNISAEYRESTWVQVGEKKSQKTRIKREPKQNNYWLEKMLRYQFCSNMDF